MRKVQDSIVPISALALALYLWGKKTGVFDSLPVIGPFFWPTSVPSTVKDWKPFLDENLPNQPYKDFVLAIIWQESNGVHVNPDGSVIRGADGEIGLCQILPATGEGLGYSFEDLLDPAKNVQACHDYLIEALEAWDKWHEENPGTGVTAAHEMFRYYNGGPRVVLDHDKYINLSRGYADQVVHKFNVLLEDGVL